MRVRTAGHLVMEQFCGKRKNFAAEEGNEYYIYARRAGEIPYVMVRTYRYEDETELIHYEWVWTI